MKKCFSLWLTVLISIHSTFSQVNQSKEPSPYQTNLLKDGAIIAGGIGLNVLGYKLIQSKKDLNPAALATKTRDKVPFFDRSSAGFYSQKADEDSYIPFKASFVMPVLMALVNKNERQKLGQL